MINQRMLAALRTQHQVLAFDMAPRVNLLVLILLWWRFVISIWRHKPVALYLALSGGLRQWVDLAFIQIAHWRRIPIFVHHHSFSYVSEGHLSTVMRTNALRKAVHVVLCEKMGVGIVQLYKISPSKIRVLSNAAFLDGVLMPMREGVEPGSLRVGFLSNITAEKGIFEFFAVLSKSEFNGLALQGVIAGPVDAAVSSAFNTSLVKNENVTYVGPVYGSDKSSFFSGIDVLFFPTRYPNEAQPVTILEALSHGVPVVAFARGCIEGMVPAGAGAVFPYSDGFVCQTIDALRLLAESPAALAKARYVAHMAFESQRATDRAVLDNLVAEIGGTVNFGQNSA
jgi:glycosyltransferase involved in cell wall biosynthesis